jgi:hypothetical protein
MALSHIHLTYKQILWMAFIQFTALTVWFVAWIATLRAERLRTTFSVPRLTDAEFDVLFTERMRKKIWVLSSGRERIHYNYKRTEWPREGRVFKAGMLFSERYTGYPRFTAFGMEKDMIELVYGLCDMRLITADTLNHFLNQRNIKEVQKYQTRVRKQNNETTR